MPMSDRAREILLSALGLPEVRDEIVTMLNDLFIKRDGTQGPNADVSWESKKLTNLATPTSANDATTKGYVDTAVSNPNISNTYLSQSPGTLPAGVAIPALSVVPAAGDYLVYAQLQYFQDPQIAWSSAITLRKNGAIQITSENQHNLVSFEFEGQTHELIFQDNFTLSVLHKITVNGTDSIDVFPGQSNGNAVVGNGKLFLVRLS
jgi:hypothetical protein